MLDLIYSNICNRSIDESSAEGVISAIEQAIFSLETMPQRGSEVSRGLFANRGYRKMLVKNHLIIYAILDERKEVIVVYVKNVRMDI